jgi:uncharacterized damage-inducible protein DinB/uncharacterized protein YndB with AHSA1/START domain
MSPNNTLSRLWDHAFWADNRILEAIQAAGGPTEAIREFAHLLGAEETWLSRLERRAPRTAVWPELPLESLARHRDDIHAGIRALLDAIGEDAVDARVDYANSAGQAFHNTVSEILLHAALHGQYHRGKINLLLRQADKSPAPVDLIAYFRGVPAATKPIKTTLTHVHEEVFAAPPERVFALLYTPTAIRRWWGAAQAIVIPEPGGLWMATWGDSEDAPDYTTGATISVFDPPHRLALADYRYRARTGALPFQANFTTEFAVTPHADGSSLRVAQHGFPATAEGEVFLAACDTGWRNTFAGIRTFLSESKP